MLRPAHVLSAQPSVLGRHGAGLLMVAAAGAVAFAVATDRPRSATVVASIPLVAVLVGELVRRAARTPANVRSASVVLALLIASTFVWRTRTTTALDSNPLDAAALVRVGLVVTAGLAALVMAVREPVVRALPGSLRWLRAYVAVAAISGLASPLPLQGSYRAFELAVGFVALVGAISLLRERAPAILVRFLVRTIGCLVAVIWLEALVAPAKAWSPSVSVLPYELQGYLPQYSSNTVGLFGGLLALYGLAEAGRTRRANGLALVAGLATLVASQYRTGIVAFIVVGLLVLWRRRPGRVAVLLVAVLPVVVGLGWARISEQSAQVFDKGRPELVGSLDSRTVYWRAAAPFIRQRPSWDGASMSKAAACSRRWGTRRRRRSTARGSRPCSARASSAPSSSPWRSCLRCGRVCAPGPRRSALQLPRCSASCASARSRARRSRSSTLAL
jgi:hypothetical protein